MLAGRVCVPEVDRVQAGFVGVTGGGSNAEALYTEWQQVAADAGVASLVFDARGKGGSEGVWQNGVMCGPNNRRGNSQLTRVADTMNALDAFAGLDLCATKPTLLGTSMGGDIALRVTHKRPDVLSSLILKAPAAYHPEAHLRQYGWPLRAVLQNPEKYPPLDSENFGMLRCLPLPAQLIFPEGEDVIPSDVRQKLEGAVGVNPFVELLNVGDTTTRHGYFFQEDEVARDAKQQTFE